MTALADTLRQASRVNEAMRVVTAQLDRGLAARSIKVDHKGVHVIVTDGAKARWDRTFPHGHIVVGGAQVPLHVAVEGVAS